MRLTNKAKEYFFVHRPGLDKQELSSKQREDKLLKNQGAIRDPKFSEERFINKIFDHGRVKTKAEKKCQGCDLDFQIRNKLIGIGKITRGSLKMLNNESAYETYRIMNIDRNSKIEKQIQENIQNRGVAGVDSAFNGDNHFRNIIEAKRKKINFSALMNYDSPTKDKNCYGKPLTKNYYYFDRLSMSQ